MEEKIPCFISRSTQVGKKLKYRMKIVTGEVVDLEMWDLINKFGADVVLQMRKELPEFEEEDGNK